MRNFPFLQAALCLSLCGGALLAQDVAEDNAEQNRFVEVVDVEIVNIDVWVTDWLGDPVNGLTQEDFEVFRWHPS